MIRAVILAAGEGTRLRPYTLDRPKCLVPLAGRTLLDWQLAALRSAGIGDITVVTGYRAEAIRARGLATVHNPRYDVTNMVASLMCARELLDDGHTVLICYGDLVYETRVVSELLATPEPFAITIDKAWQRLWALRMEDPLADAESLRLDGMGRVLELGRPPGSVDEIEGQYMGLIKVDAEMASLMVRAFDDLDPEGPYEGRDRDNMFMTTFLQHLIDSGVPLAAVPVDGGWLEVDTTEDLDVYESMQSAGSLGAYCVLGG